MSRTGARATACAPPNAPGAPEVPTSRRLSREKRTVGVMVRIYCRAHHATLGGAAVTARPGLCPTCATLLDYAARRIDACRFRSAKPTCARCTVHCFGASEREAIRQVMRYSGPRMVTRHPYLAARHLLDRHHAPERTQT